MFGLRLGLQTVITASSGVPNSAEAQQYLDRLVPYPSAEREVILATFIDGLVAANVWDSLDFLYIFAHTNSGSAFTNIKGTSYQAVEYKATSGLTFTVDQGFSGGVIGHHISSQFNPSTASSPQYMLNDCMFGVYISDSTQRNAQSIYTATTALPQTPVASSATLYPKWSSGNCTIEANGTASAFAVVVASDGLWMVNRTTSNLTKTYRQGLEVGSNANAAVSVKNGVIRCLATHPVSLMFAGASLDGTQRVAFETLVADLINSITAVP